MSNSQKPGNNLPPVKTVKEFLERINGIVKTETEKGSKVLFRGQENEEWKVETSAYRRLKGEAKQEKVSEEDELYYNLGLIQQFKHADFHSDYKSKIMQLDLGILAQLQHMGAATSLVDFTDNAMTALWFACKKSINLDNNNGKVFILSTGGKDKLDEIDSIEQIESSKVRVPEELYFFEGNNILNNRKLIYWKPAHLNNRITAQQSYFLISKREPPKMQEIIIAGNSKVDIIKELSTVHGINGAMLFPDLVGFAQVNSVSSAYGKEEKMLRKKIIIHHHDEIIEKICKEQEDTEANKVVRTTKLTKAYNNRAIAKYKLNDYEGSIDDFTKTINIDLNNLAAFNNRGIVKSELQDYQNSINDYNKAIEINPNNASSYQNRANVKIKLQNYKGAIDDYNEVIKIKPRSADTYYNLGVTRYELKEYKDAIDNFDKAIEINLNYTTAYNNRGSTKYELGDYKGAIDDYNKAIEIDSNYSYAYYNRGIVKDKLNNYEGSIDDYNQSIELAPNDAIAYYNRGNSKYQLSTGKYKLKNYKGVLVDYKEALSDYKTALKFSEYKDLIKRIVIGIKQVQKALNNLQNKVSTDKNLTKKINILLKKIQKILKDLNSKLAKNKK